jgi:Raf kinase inhibitor-like YbhB/YbcL family protein
VGVPDVVASVVGACALLASCGGGDQPQVEVSPDIPTSVRVTSPAFSEGDRLPSRFTCDGDGEAPPLAWDGGPPQPASWAVVVDDPDAPGGTFVHWVVLDVPAGVRELARGRLPNGSVQARTSGGEPGYTPACPPRGEHRYRFTVYALGRPTGLAGDVGLDAALAAVSARATARGVLVATYSRP